MKKMIFIAAMLIGCSGFSQVKEETQEDRTIRLWKTADTLALNKAYETSKVIPIVPVDAGYETLKAERRRFDHELEIERMRMIYMDYFYWRPIYRPIW